MSNTQPSFFSVITSREHTLARKTAPPSSAMKVNQRNCNEFSDYSRVFVIHRMLLCLCLSAQAYILSVFNNFTFRPKLQNKIYFSNGHSKKFAINGK
jgi:hypothetical protein